MNGTWVDQAVLIVYIGGILGMSLVIARRQRSGQEYFLASRSMGSGKLAMSVIANQLSAVSLIGAPAFVALRADGGLKWLQYEIAVPIAMIVLIALVLPIIRSVRGASIYEFAEWRFGHGTRQMLASAFLISRGLALGVILYASSAVIAATFQVSLDSAIILVGLVCVVYTTLGGIVADIWTDIIQLLVLTAGTLASVMFLGMYGDGVLWSWIPEERTQTLVMDSVGAAGNGDFGFWPMLFGGLFLYVSYYGCDQSQAQRLLTARSDAAANRTLVLNGLFRFPLVLTYCVLGLLLAALLRYDPAFAEAVSAGPPDGLVSQFILYYLPPGLRGLFLASILAAAMSSIDSAMNSLAAVTLEDVLGLPAEKQSALLSRATSLGWGLFGVCSGLFFARSGDSVIVLINMIGSAFYGPVLAVFILGAIAPQVQGLHAVSGLLGGLAGNLLLAWFAPDVSWLWWNPFGFAVAMLFSLAAARAKLEPPVLSLPRLETSVLWAAFVTMVLFLAINPFS
ncbi:MAG TPA: sodium transporter [Terriglobia bacterium]|nr:sodium transporter [Terriglobia bacterium]